MPDKWGRIGYNDFMGITHGLKNIQAMGQNKVNFDQSQQFNTDVETNLAAMKAGPQQTRPYEVDGAYVSPDQLQQPVQLTGSERSQIAAKEGYLKGLDADLGIADHKQAESVRGRSEGITAWIQENPGQSIDKVPSNLTAGVDGQKALANVLGLHGKTAEAQKQLMETRIPIIREQAKNFFQTKKLVTDALEAGKTDMAVNGLVQMSKDLKLTPYQLGEYNPETKSFSLNYFDRRTGKLQKSGTKGLDEVVNEMNAMGEKEFINITAASMEAKRLENIKEEASPAHGKTSGGVNTLVTAQIKVMDQDGSVDISVKNEKTGELLAKYTSWDAFYDAGNSKEDLKRTKALADIGAVESLKGEREDKAKYHRAQTAALGGKGKAVKKVYYDDQGNEYQAESESEATDFEKKGFTIENPTQNKEMYENKVKSFAIQTRGLGFVQDEETKDVSGIIKRDDMGQALKIANGMGLSLFDEQGLEIDQNGWVPGGKKEAMKVSVLPMGTKKSGGDLAAINNKGMRFDSDASVDQAPGQDGGVKTKTNAMGGDKAKTIISQMSKDEIKGIYKFGAFDEPGTTPLTAAQKLLSHSQSDKHEKFGEGPVEKALRDAGIETNLQKQKTIAKALKSKFPDATEAQIVAMIEKSVSKEQPAMGGR